MSNAALKRTGCTNDFDDQYIPYPEIGKDYFREISGHYERIRNLNLEFSPEILGNLIEHTLQMLTMARFWQCCHPIIVLDGVPVGQSDCGDIVVFFSARDDILRVAAYYKKTNKIGFYKLPVGYKSKRILESPVGHNEAANLDEARPKAHRWVAKGMWQDQETRTWYDYRPKWTS